MEIPTVQWALRLLSLFLSLASIICSPVLPGQRFRRQIKESELMLREICRIGDGEFRHPMSCNAYLQCKDGMYTEQLCPGNMVYDIHIKACNYKRKVRCSLVDGLSEYYDDGATVPSTTTSTTTTTEEPAADDGAADDGEDSTEDVTQVEETTTPSTTPTTVVMKKMTQMRVKKTASATIFYYRQADPTTRDENEVTTTTQRTVPRPTVHLTKQEVPRLRLASMNEGAPGIEESNTAEAVSKINIGVVQMGLHPMKAPKPVTVAPVVTLATTTEQNMVPSLKAFDMTAPAKSDQEEEECVIWEGE